MSHHSSWNIPLLLSLLALLFLYWLLIGFLKKRNHEQIQITKKRIYSFTAGCLLLFITFGSPLAYYSHTYLTIHMLQMSILCFIIPPLLIYGMPASAYGTFIPHFIKKLPSSTAALVFAFFFFLYHMPGIFNQVNTHHLTHIAYHALLFLSALLMWLPSLFHFITKGTGRPKKTYFSFMMLVTMPACVLLLFANHELYSIYQPVHGDERLFSAITDQRISGLLMIILHQLAMYAAAKLNQKHSPDIHVPPTSASSA
ncbi:putative membrane protein/putative membrane protein [Alteribacillus persepolensis]|uniref:Putative membrane protein/putative membrane protein n=1 Tax=Alteribacillus persepolensis TaxID=568899 RepID=A0A1G8AL81_9BACI|nr:cytochrome c oxidase assembly protein [Alteribacillus persepolensis]SDH21677.1 putative membrane protein/putative membrane protein [Alteribacillus persepolensis]